MADHKCVALVVAAAAVLLAARPANATPLAEAQESARGIALGSGARAAGASTAALAYDPAGMVSERVYHIEAFSGYENEAERWTYGGAVVDSALNPSVAGGIALRGITGNGEFGYSGIDGRVALALPLANMLSFGVAGRYLSLSRYEAGSASEPAGSRIAKGFSLDMSLRLAPMETVAVSLLAYNMLDRHSALVPQEVGGSAAVHLGQSLSLGADLLFDLSRDDEPTAFYGGGIEFFAGAVLPLRFGYARDEGIGENFLTGGLGYVDARYGFEFAIRRGLSDRGDTEVFASLRLFVQAQAASESD